jgi:hypothetical protein
MRPRQRALRPLFLRLTPRPRHGEHIRRRQDVVIQREHRPPLVGELLRVADHLELELSGGLLWRREPMHLLFLGLLHAR